jgi:hypothetical protein
MKKEEEEISLPLIFYLGPKRLAFFEALFDPHSTEKPLEICFTMVIRVGVFSLGFRVQGLVCFLWFKV